MLKKVFIRAEEMKLRITKNQALPFIPLYSVADYTFLVG